MVLINPTPLKGIVLAGCAKANANAGVIVAAQRCGYGSNVRRFIEELQSVCSTMSVEDTGLAELMTEQCQIRELQPVGVVKRGSTGK
ncbi:MAG: hypothetical protein AAGI69_05650 [Cyanobacteria bacterium P01_H01_bin.21]